MVTSFIPTDSNQQFITSQSERGKVSKTSIINNALDLYRKFIIARDLKAGFSEQTDEDVEEAMVNFEDYLKIVDNE